MSKSAGDDDFFGIEYISSSSNQKYNEEQKSSVRIPTEEEPVAGIEKLKRLVKESQCDQLPGSVFVDSTYFPELVDPSVSTETKDEKELDASDFDRTYFSQIIDRKDESPLKLEPRESDQFYEDLGRHSQKKITRRAVENDENQMEIRESDKFYEDIRQKQNEEIDKPKVEHKSKERPPSDRERIEKMDKYVAELLADEVIYQSPNLIAFNKPFNLGYSGNVKGYQIDRALQKLKFIVAPKVERLHLVRSLDRDLSGILLFATSKFAQNEAKDMLKDGKLIHKCISYGELKEPVEVNTPLIKVIKQDSRDVKMVPLTSNKTSKPIHYGTTVITPRKSNGKQTYLTATTTNEIYHQLRCHLSLAQVPLFNDPKYGKPNVPFDPYILPPKEASTWNGRDWDIFNLRGIRKAPMFSHLYEMRLPEAKQEIIIRARLPRYFILALKKLKIYLH